ncbi:oxidoreductase domain-containing protein [Glycocaulis alkaliphilus]|uniref:Oxidoreductase domain-containing protein n=1 Tax=Glycocaulis alkaliphilus TaxID=1434191 RepID=A0A3T0E9A0_9PROT|nr:Gfo/Idh/MocA family oxidoreductase [Glycocaulis alkaliphilus]AZU04015.1 oxidoreductase domain-containing protein [Glycocaulis alkaliphilus]GGB75098.1 oxidoreductase [Glycocaulis alkaliphilus]
MSNASQPLRAGVVGAGVFGGYHAGKYAGDARTEFIGVFDPVRDRARAIARQYGAIAFTSLNAMIEEADIITVASPALFHHDAAHRALAAGRHVLVEKPICATVEEGRELLELARKYGRVLQVGHQERFVFAAMGLFGTLPPARTLSARRMGTPSPRNLDVSVTLDLMIHDIDLVLALAGSAPSKVEADMRAERGGLADHIVTRLEFPGGQVAELESSRVAADRDRVMTIEFEGGAVLDVDFIRKRFENGAGLPLDPGFADAPMAKDSLGASVQNFVSRVLDPAHVSPAADGQAGVLALETALAIDAAAGSLSRM